MTQPSNSMMSYLKMILLEEDKVLFQEASTCFQNNALRAAYLMLWISCVESLKRRFKDLSSKDSTAGKIWGDIQKKETDQKSIDGFLIEKSFEYGFLDQTEKSKLSYHYMMRCIYGHPYEQHPTQESVLAAARDVVDIVLSKPVKLRHSYLQEQLNLLETDPSYVDNIEPAVAEYVEKLTARTDEALSVWFLEKLCDSLNKLASIPSSSPLYFRLLTISWEYARRLFPHFIGDVPALLTKHPTTLPLTLSVSGVFENLDSQSKDRIIGFLCTEGPRSSQCCTMIAHLSEKGLLSERHQTRFNELATSLTVAQIVVAEISPSYIYDRLVDALKSRNWYRQSPAIDEIRTLGRTGISMLTERQQQTLGNNVLQSAEGDSKTAIKLICDIGYESEPWPKAFIEGIVTECFINEKNQLRAKVKFLENSLVLLSKISESDILDITKRIADKIPQSTVKWKHDSMDEVAGQCKRALERVALAGSIKRHYVNNIIEALADLPAKSNGVAEAESKTS